MSVPGDAKAAPADRSGHYRLACLVIVMVAAVLTLFAIRDIPPPQYEPVGGAAVPGGAAVLILLTCGAAAILELRRQRPNRPFAPVERSQLLRCLAFVVATLAYALLLSARTLGFGLLTGVYLGFLFCLYERPAPRRALVPLLAIVLFSVALELLFTKVFVIDLVSSF